MSGIQTITRTYPVQVVDINGKPVKIGKPVKLPLKKARAYEARFGLEPADVDSDAKSGTKSSSDAK